MFFESVDSKLIAGTIDTALLKVRTDRPGDWCATFPPFCRKEHLLSEILGQHDEGPAFVYQILRHISHPHFGIFVCGHSTIYPRNEHGPAANRITPALGAISFRGVISADIDRTYSEIFYSHPVSDCNVTVPLEHDGDGLRVHAAGIGQDDADVIAMCLV